MTGLSKILSVARDRAGLSQAELARRIPMNQGHLNRVESGERETNWARVDRWLEECDARIVVAPRSERVPEDIAGLSPEDRELVLRLARILPLMDPGYVANLGDQLEAWERRFAADQSGTSPEATSHEIRAKVS